MRSKSNRHLFVTVKRSLQSTHDRSRKDAQQKQSSVVGYSQAITAKDSRQKPQGFAAKIVNCSTGDHCKILTREAVMIHTQQNHSRSLFRTEAIHSFFFFFFFYKNVVFPAQAEYSYFSLDFGLRIFLYYS